MIYPAMHIVYHSTSTEQCDRCTVRWDGSVGRGMNIEVPHSIEVKRAYLTD